MILLTLAIAAAAQWTGPRSEGYRGPGYFCGGGYAVQLLKGDRALVLPQSQSAGIQGVRLVLGGREVNVWSGASREPGRVVARYGGTAVIEHNEAGEVTYLVSDQTDFGLQVKSQAFHGFKRDGWFFGRANFSSTAENRVRCLSAVSY